MAADEVGDQHLNRGGNRDGDDPTDRAEDRRPDEDGTRATDDRTADRVADVITMINGVVQAPNSVFGVVKKNGCGG